MASVKNRSMLSNGLYILTIQHAVKLPRIVLATLGWLHIYIFLQNTHRLIDRPTFAFLYPMVHSVNNLNLRCLILVLRKAAGFSLQKWMQLTTLF